MLLPVRVINSGRHPPLLTRDDLLTMIRVEDQSGGRRIRRLLTGLHHDDQQPFKLVAESLDVPLDQLRQWMYWLRIEILEIELPTPITPIIEYVDEVATAKADQWLPPVEKPVGPDQNGFVQNGEHKDRFVHQPTGLVISSEIKKAIDQSCIENSCTLAELCREPYYWPMMFITMSDEAYGIPKGIYEVFIKHYRGTLGKLDKDDIKPDKVVVEVAEPEHPTSEAIPEPASIRHESAIDLTSHDWQAIKQYCQQQDCTEEEFFRQRFNVTKIADIANEIGINPNLCIHLWNYWRQKEEPVAGG